MSKLILKNVVCQILFCEYRKYSQSEIGSKETANSQVHNNIPKKFCFFSLLKSCLNLGFDVIGSDTNNRYADGDNIGSIYSVSIASLIIFEMTMSSVKQLEDNRAYGFSLKYKLISSANGPDDSSVEVDSDLIRRQRVLKKKQKESEEKISCREYAQGSFCFCVRPEKPTCGLG